MKRPNQTVFTLLILLSMTAWGASWSSGKMIAPLAPPEVLIFWRFLFTFFTFIPVMLIFKKPFRVKSSSFIYIVLGSLFIVSYNKFFFLGLQNGFAGTGGVLVTTFNPILTFLFTIILFKQRIRGKQIVGLILGFTGGAILLEIWTINLDKLLQSGNAYFLLASVSWASLTITSEKSRMRISPLIFSFYVFGLSALLDFFLALPLGVWDFFNKGWVLWLNILYLSVFATTFATTIYFYASGRLGSQRASSYIFLVPASAVLISWAVLGETIRLTTVIGGMIAILAVYLINVRSKDDVG